MNDAPIVVTYLLNTEKTTSGAKSTHKAAVSASAASALTTIAFSKTQRGRDMLVYCGYRYVQNRQSTRNKFWRCSRYVKFGCRATVVTSRCLNEPTIRLTGMAHSHGPDAKEEDALMCNVVSDGGQQLIEETDATAAEDEDLNELMSTRATTAQPLVDLDAGDLPKSLFGDDAFEELC